jgi:regulator of PEP synthase PpsR (kinase-PPPase family)
MVYTLVERDLREAMRLLCRRARVHYCDLLGHPIDSISRVAGVAARMQPGARAPLDSTYFKRIEAIEFAVKYDDGVGKGLDEADIVLVGVSRTSKTPLSIYLGYLGHKAANVPVGSSLPRSCSRSTRRRSWGSRSELTGSPTSVRPA